MALIDANILVYAYVSFFAQHIAHDWLGRQLNAAACVGLPWPSVLAFQCLVTNPRVFEHPEPYLVAAPPHRPASALRRFAGRLMLSHFIFEKSAYPECQEYFR